MQNRLYNDPTPVRAKEDRMMVTYNVLAKYYDTMNMINSFGLNNKIKRNLIEHVAPSPGAKHIDMATGTGQIPQFIFEYHRKVNNDNTATVHAVDLNESMINIAKDKFKRTPVVSENRLTFEVANAENLSTIQENTYDVYTISTGLHNMSHPDNAIKEAYRVLKPGGTFACIEFGHVDSVAGWIAFCIFKLATILFRLLFICYNDNFSELAQSAQTFGSQKDIVNSARNAGFIVPGKGYENIFFGVFAIVIGIKPESNR